MENKLEELFNSIENSSLYKEYKQMEDILSKDKSIKKQIEEIKQLEQEATHLEHIGDPKYKEIDEQIKEKAVLLNSNPVYQEYLSRMDDFNDELAASSKMISDYINEKV